MGKSLSSVVNIADLREGARRRLPRAVFDYLDGGPDDEITLRDNRVAFQDIVFKPRHAVAIPKCDLGTSVLGIGLDLPFMLAPVGYSRLMHADGELGAARAAGRAGTAYILSTVSGYALEDVKAAASGPLFYQLYLIGGRGAGEAAIARARAAGYKALVITIDTPLAGNREKDFRNGAAQLIGKNPFAKLPYLPDVLMHPGWLAGHVIDGGMTHLPNVIIPGRGGMPLAQVNSSHSGSAVSWEDFPWIREQWRGPIVVKGVMTVEDARRSVDEGAAAIVVSNHGGRQLDSVDASIRALPAIAAAVGTQAEIWLDSGIRRGSDIVKALCLGAKAVICGRAYAYGLAAGGEPGIDKAIDILRNDLVRTLKLLGCARVSDLDRSYIALRRPEKFL